MIFSETELKGAYIIEPEKIQDDRGFFARILEQKKFEEMGLDGKLLLCNISFNENKGTLRGMHYQESPYEETKLVRCIKGKIFDVIIDLRLTSNTFKKWIGIELSDKNYKMIYVPKGFAHGFQTLEDNAEVLYLMSDCYMPEYARGIRWNDRSIGIKWPSSPSTISKRDAAYKDLE